MPDKYDMEESRSRLREMESTRRALRVLGQHAEEEDATGMVIREIRLQGPSVTGADYRAIVKGEAGGRRFVAFHNATNMTELLAGVASRIQNGSIGWKEDLPYSPEKRS